MAYTVLAVAVARTSTISSQNGQLPSDLFIVGTNQQDVSQTLRWYDSAIYKRCPSRNLDAGRAGELCNRPPRSRFISC